MNITALDPNTALIIIDLQKGIVSLPVVHPIASIIERSSLLARIFRHHGLPVVLVNVVAVPPGRTEQIRFSGALPDDFADFVSELTPELNDHIVSKRTAGAFTKTDLEEWLLKKGVTQVVIVGIATSMGVVATARQGHELGFNVTFAIDAITDMDEALHDVLTMKVFPRLGKIGTTTDLIKLFEQR